MDKYVYAKIAEQPVDKNGKPYWKITDQENQVWHIFRSEIQTFFVGKSYLFTYELNEKGFPDISKITLLANVFKQAALKEVSNKNDVVRNLAVSMSYAKDLAVGKLITLEEMFKWSDSIYDYFQNKATSIIGEVEEK